MAPTRNYFRAERLVERREFSSTDPSGERTGEYVVRGYSILSTDTVIFNVWEPLSRDAETGRYSHSTSFTSGEYGPLGALTSRALPAEIDALPIGDDRTAACNHWHAELDRLALSIISAAFPELGPSLRFSYGEGSASLDDVNAAVRS